jgi:aminomethyltransferase
VQYTSVINETLFTRKNAGLFDVSHMGQFRLTGENVLAELQKLITNDLSKMQLNQAQYNMLCNESGGVIDDLIVYKISEKELFICVNASNIDADFTWMKNHLPKSLNFVNESSETSLIALQGPLAEKILCSKNAAEPIQNLKYYYGVDSTLFGKDVFLSRTGYTGEDGFEIYCKNEDAAYLWETLLEVGGDKIAPIGLGARDTLRLEMGYPLHGHELGLDKNPLEASLSWVVKLNKESFIGKEALVKVKQAGPEKVLKAFTTKDRRIPRAEYKIKNIANTEIGFITSGSHSPHTNGPIALGFIYKNYLNSTEFFVDIRNELVPISVTTLPFIPTHVKK